MNQHNAAGRRARAAVRMEVFIMRCPAPPHIVLVTALLAVSAARADTPRIVELSPEPGATDVDPNLRFIRVKFDQDMTEGSHSWCGGGDTFPQMRGAPYWEDRRTAVLPVQLELDHQYELGINCPAAQGFRNQKGEPAKPRPLKFKTAPKRAPVDMQQVIAAENKASVPILRRTVEKFYAYRDRHDIKWDQQFVHYTAHVAAADSPAAFAERATAIFAPAKDPHITLGAGGRWFATFQRRYEPNFSIRILPQVVENWQRRSACVATGRFDGDVGYIVLPSWEQRYKDDLEAAYKALEAFQDTQALIIDVRPNAGGDETLAREFAGCFVDEPVVYAKHVSVWPEAPDGSGFTKPQERVLEPSRGRPKYRKQVLVLMGPGNMSSAEAFLLMMKQAPNCRLVGAPSYGSSGNPKAYGLPNGVVVRLPSWKAMTPAGLEFEGEGIAPDIRVSSEPGDFAKSDPVIDVARKILAGGFKAPGDEVP